MDAIEHGQPQPDEGRISVHINFDAEEVTVCDNGAGFPNQPRLLFLGGGCKGQAKQRGRVGVGIKVTLFSSKTFVIQSRTDSEQWRIDIADAYKFEKLPSLRVPATFPADPSPLSSCGTSVKYTFPDDLPPADRMLTHFLTEVVAVSLPKGFKTGFAKHIAAGTHKYPSQIAAILACYLRRYSYLADVLNTMQDGKKTTFPPKGIEVSLRLTCSDPGFSLSAGDRGAIRQPDRPGIHNCADLPACQREWLVEQEGTVYLRGLSREGWRQSGKNRWAKRAISSARPRIHQEFEQLVTDRRGHLPRRNRGIQDLPFPEDQRHCPYDSAETGILTRFFPAGVGESFQLMVFPPGTKLISSAVGIRSMFGASILLWTWTLA